MLEVGTIYKTGGLILKVHSLHGRWVKFEVFTHGGWSMRSRAEEKKRIEEHIKSGEWIEITELFPVLLYQNWRIYKMNFIEKFEEQNNCFGTVTWTVEDLENALETQEVPITKENITALYDAVQENIDKLTEKMIEAGWNYIYDIISDAVRWGELETN